LTRSLAGPPRPAPFARRTSLLSCAQNRRSDFVPAAPPLRAHSRGPHAPLRSRGALRFSRALRIGGGTSRFPHPPYALTRGAPTPRSVRAAHFASLVRSESAGGLHAS